MIYSYKAIFTSFGFVIYVVISVTITKLFKKKINLFFRQNVLKHSQRIKKNNNNKHFYSLFIIFFQYDL